MSAELEKLTNKLASGVAAAMTEAKVDAKRVGFVLLVTEDEGTAFATTKDAVGTLAHVEHVANELRAKMGLPAIPVPE